MCYQAVHLTFKLVLRGVLGGISESFCGDGTLSRSESHWCGRWPPPPLPSRMRHSTVRVYAACDNTTVPFTAGSGEPLSDLISTGLDILESEPFAQPALCPPRASLASFGRVAMEDAQDRRAFRVHCNGRLLLSSSSRRAPPPAGSHGHRLETCPKLSSSCTKRSGGAELKVLRLIVHANPPDNNRRDHFSPGVPGFQFLPFALLPGGLRLARQQTLSLRRVNE